MKIYSICILKKEAAGSTQLSIEQDVSSFSFFQRGMCLHLNWCHVRWHSVWRSAVLCWYCTVLGSYIHQYCLPFLSSAWMWLFGFLFLLLKILWGSFLISLLSLVDIDQHVFMAPPVTPHAYTLRRHGWAILNVLLQDAFGTDSSGDQADCARARVHVPRLLVGKWLVGDLHCRCRVPCACCFWPAF